MHLKSCSGAQCLQLLAHATPAPSQPTHPSQITCYPNHLPTNKSTRWMIGIPSRTAQPPPCQRHSRQTACTVSAPTSGGVSGRLPSGVLADAHSRASVSRATTAQNLPRPCMINAAAPFHEGQRSRPIGLIFHRADERRHGFFIYAGFPRAPPLPLRRFGMLLAGC